MNERTKRIIQQVARERSLTPEQVEEEIRTAIREAMSSTDPRAQMLWRQIAPDGKEPTIDAFLEFCARTLHQRREQWERSQRDKRNLS